MKLITVMNRLLGLPKLLKNKHTIEMDFIIDDKEEYTLSKYSFNQNETVMFLQTFNRELEIIKKKDFDYKKDKEKIPLITIMFTDQNNNFVLYDKENEKMKNEVHLINLRIITPKKTQEFKNIEKNVSKILNPLKILR